MKVLRWAAAGLALLLLPGTAGADSDAICCTWINPEYTSASPAPVQIRNPDGTFADYMRPDSRQPLRRGTFTIMKK